MRRIIEYDIAKEETAGELSYSVGLALKGGWQPFGSPYATSYFDEDGNTRTTHYQPIVKYDSE